ncbi:MAG TPA: hypothetical protein VMR70_06925 [Flavisolibacter sp.]|nr:hypothetical protein [Flavisolibacter sp.]
MRFIKGILEDELKDRAKTNDGHTLKLKLPASFGWITTGQMPPEMAGALTVHWLAAQFIQSFFPFM